ncbi:hypothetical protein SLAVM298S_06924 [Streptomyces lavendulae subsp. lavendulae]
MQAKPVAVNPASTNPSAGPVNCRLRKAKTSSSAAALALSSTTGAIATEPNRSASKGSVVAAAIHSVAKLFASIAISAAVQAPQPKQNINCRQGAGAARPSHRNAAISGGTGSRARPRPTRKPAVPVCSRTSSRIVNPVAVSRVTGTHTRTGSGVRASTRESARSTW